MNFIEFFLKKPALVGAIVTFILALGAKSLIEIPIQLTPDVQTPTLTVQTIWPGASPKEIEKEIVIKQEEVLGGIPNLEKISSESTPNQGRVILEFVIGTDLNDAILRVSNELDQITNYPENANRPRILSSGSNSSPIVWMRLAPLENNSVPIDEFQKYAEDKIVPEFEKLKSVSEVRVYGGKPREIKVTFDSEKLAFYRIGIDQLIRAIRQENVNISGGTISEGKREYVIRTLSSIREFKDLESLILKKEGGNKVYLRDVASVSLSFKSPRSRVLYNDTKALILPVYKVHGSNVLEVTDQIIALIDKINRKQLKNQKLVLNRLADQRYYITNSISLVVGNLVIGSLLAFFVLLLFLGNFRPAVVVLLSIPISIMGTFVCLQAFGRNINVVSLSGMAFAVGMVVDSAIVVLENIDEYRLRGYKLYDAALKATQEIWGAILASSLTTVAIFLPVLFVKEKAGQLFADIAIAISSSILLSLLVAVAVIPTLYKWILGDKKVPTREERQTSKSIYNRMRRLIGKLVDWSLRFLGWILVSWTRKLVFLGIVLWASWAAIFYLSPKLEYLPSGNRNLIFGILIPPPGYNTEEVERIGRFVMKELKPAMEGKIAGLAEIDRVFYIGFGTRLIIGGAAKDPERVKELIPIFKRALSKVPGMYVITTQSSIFERGLSAGRSIDVNLHGNDLETLAGIGGGLFMKIRKIIPGSQIRPIPSLEIGTPEIQVLLDRERAAEHNITTAELGTIIDIYTDGRKIDEYTDSSGNILDISLLSKDKRVQSVADFSSLTIVTKSKQRIPIATIATVTETVGPNQINRIDQKRAITLRVTPPDNLSLEDAMKRLQSEIVEPTLAANQYLEDFDIRLSGTADDFTKTRTALQSGFIAALGITFLLLVVLFEDFLAPLVIMSALPIAGAGGMVMLYLINQFLAPQSLDVLVMLGFLMLVGIVVNNPILIVHRSLYLMREENMDITTAVIEGVRSRYRPIFMSTLTSVLGLMPLVIIPGAGAELYRGLGGAVLGGLLFSTFLSLYVIPIIFTILEKSKKMVSIPKLSPK